jgi:hypothetical protein
MADMKERRAGPIFAVVLASPLLLAAYLGAYWAMLEGMIFNTRHGMVPVYRFDTRNDGNSVFDASFWPIYLIDRRIRPAYWSEAPLPTPLIDE